MPLCQVCSAGDPTQGSVLARGKFPPTEPHAQPSGGVLLVVPSHCPHHTPRWQHLPAFFPCSPILRIDRCTDCRVTIKINMWDSFIVQSKHTKKPSLLRPFALGLVRVDDSVFLLQLAPSGYQRWCCITHTALRTRPHPHPILPLPTLSWVLRSLATFLSLGLPCVSTFPLNIGVLPWPDALL